MSSHTLLIEDEVRIADFVVRGLPEEGDQVTHAADGGAGRIAVDTRAWDLVILDWRPFFAARQRECERTRIQHLLAHKDLSLVTDNPPTNEEFLRLQCGPPHYKPACDSIRGRLDTSEFSPDYGRNRWNSSSLALSFVQLL